MPIVVFGLDLLGDGTSLDSIKTEGVSSLYFFFLKKKYD
jgi:hypothetical protein|tara:strand:- start:4383 stop:4499 length:117 start_codon:yes stop_codon:yes gene_type:complete